MFGYVRKKGSRSVLHIYQDGYNTNQGPVSLTLCGRTFLNAERKSKPYADERICKVCESAYGS